MFSSIAIKMSDGVLCDSLSAQSLVIRISKEKPVEIARPIFKLNRPTNLKLPMANPFQFITWGRITPQKNLVLAIRFISELVLLGGDAQLTIVGPDEGGHISALIFEAKLRRVHDRVHFIGKRTREEIFEMAQHFGSFVISSEHEGLCIALIEAMQLGLLPVVTLVGGIREYCEDGRNCIQLDPADPAKTAKRFITMTPTERDSIVKQALLTFSKTDDYCTSFIKALDCLMEKL